MSLTESQILSEKINFEIFNSIDIGEGIKHDEQLDFLDNDYSKADIRSILELRKKLIYGNKLLDINDLNFFTIQSSEIFNSLLNNQELAWNNYIIYSPLNDHSRKFLRKGDILFCNRIGQFSSLDKALEMRGIYAVGIAIEDPKVYYPNHNDHTRYGVKIIFPISLQKNLSTRSIQLNPITIAQTPYNGNRNDSLQRIDSIEIAKEILNMIGNNNPGFSIFLDVFYNYSINSIEKKTASISYIVDPLMEFIKWFNKPENYLKSYQGLVDYDLLKSWDALFFSNNLFKFQFESVSDSISKIEEIVRMSKKDDRWTSFSQAVSKGAPAALIGEKNYIRFLKSYDFGKEIKLPLPNNYNKIIYGAPGTGKSYQITKYLKSNNINDEYIERVVFHPELDYYSFVGGIKPITKGENDNARISYEFVPQSFLRILLKALRNKNSNYYLIIEEINRGNCSEIFGDIFQLLDRNSDYKISLSTELKTYFNNLEQKEKRIFLTDGKLVMPENLILLATMNTSDQSLFPMDSAFKRRWEWEYVPICYDKTYEQDENGEIEINKSFSYEINLDDGSRYSWIEFIKKINKNHISPKPNLGMDKCIGNYFVRPEDSNRISLKQFINKVVFYLWNDVFKDEDNNVFEENSSYEDFFPIHTNGLKKVIELFERIGFDLKEDNLLKVENYNLTLATEPQEPYDE